MVGWKKRDFTKTIQYTLWDVLVIEFFAITSIIKVILVRVKKSYKNKIRMKLSKLKNIGSCMPEIPHESMKLISL